MNNGTYLDDEIVFDRVVAALVERPRTFSELFGHAAAGDGAEPIPSLDQVDEALQILYSCSAIQEFKETRFGERMRIFGLKSESRTYILCDICEGSGFQGPRRIMCYECHGNGMYTPVWTER
jgi:DnaJ-class molecular chaperone